MRRNQQRAGGAQQAGRAQQRVRGLAVDRARLQRLGVRALGVRRRGLGGGGGGRRGSGGVELHGDGTRPVELREPAQAGGAKPGDTRGGGRRYERVLREVRLHGSGAVGSVEQRGGERLLERGGVLATTQQRGEAQSGALHRLGRLLLDGRCSLAAEQRVVGGREGRGHGTVTV